MSRISARTIFIQTERHATQSDKMKSQAKKEVFRTEKTNTRKMEQSWSERVKEKVKPMCTYQRLIFKLEGWMRINYRIRQGGRRALETVVERVFRRYLDIVYYLG